MRKIFLLIALLASFAANANPITTTSLKQLKKQEFILSGTIKGHDAGMAYLRYMGSHEKYVLDSCRLDQGRFSFKGLVKNATIALITIGKKPIVDDDDMEADGKNSTLFFLESGTITAELEALSFKNGQFNGSHSQDQYAELNKQIARADAQYKASVDSLQTANPAQSKERQHAQLVLSQRAGAKKKAITRVFLDQHPDSYVTAYLVSISHFQLADLHLYYNRLSKDVRKSEAGDDIEEQIEKKEKVSVGHPAPDFTQKTAAGTQISLKDFKGKYVLLTFWSTSNDESKIENQKLLSVYNQFKDQQFDILGASIDGEKTRKIWEAAIKEEALPWTQLQALKTNHNPAAIAFDIESAPANFLIDPKGKIIGEGMKAEELRQLLSKTLAKKP